MFLNPSGNPLADAAMNRHKSRVAAGEKLPTVAQGRYLSVLIGGMETFCPGRDQMYPGGVVTCAEAFYDMGVDRDSASKVLDRIQRSGCQDDFERCQEILRQECSINLGPPSQKMSQQREQRLRASAGHQYGGTHD